MPGQQSIDTSSLRSVLEDFLDELADTLDNEDDEVIRKAVFQSKDVATDGGLDTAGHFAVGKDADEEDAE